MPLVNQILETSPLKQDGDSQMGDTTFRRDFKAPSTSLIRTVTIKPPDPARINISTGLSAGNVDDMYETATRIAYRNPTTSSKAPEKLRSNRAHQTNFKINADDRINEFFTTNHDEYSQKTVSLPSRNYASSVLKLSNPGPLGNKITLHPNIESEYLESFRGDLKQADHIKQSYNADHIKGTLHDN